MGKSSIESWLSVPALKGRLIRDSYIKAKHANSRPKMIMLLDQAEALIPTSFDIIDESVSSGYLRLMQCDRDQSFIYMMIVVSLSIYVSCFQALTKSAFALTDIGMQHAAVEGESHGISIRDRVVAIYRFLSKQARAVVQLVVDAVKAVYDVLDQDGDGQLGTADLLHVAYAALRQISQFALIVASFVFHYILIVIRKLVDVVLPPPPGPVKPQALLHQNSPSKISDEKLERFEQPAPESITIIRIVEVVYDRLLIRAGPWVQRIAAWTDIVYQLVHRVIRSCNDKIQAMFSRGGAAADAGSASPPL